MYGSAYAYGRDQGLDARNAFAPVRAPTTFEQYGVTLGGPIFKNKLFYFLGYEGEKLTVPSVYTVSDLTTADWGRFREWLHQRGDDKWELHEQHPRCYR